MQYIFDVDGTLTPSRQRIDLGFEKFLMDFCEDNKVYFVTGSDRDKTLEQLGVEIYDRAQLVYNCSGNSIWKQDTLIDSKNWYPSSELIDELFYIMMDTKYRFEFTGKHIEFRPGCINFSIVGRKADWLHRQKYIAHDEEYFERFNIVNRLSEKFPELCASIGGETGIDIFPMGWDKSQILDRDFNDCSNVRFFGDMVEEGGNDYSIAQGVLERGGRSYAVTDYKDTWKLLCDLQ